MKTKTDRGAQRRSCPDCDHPLLPVHAVEGAQRRVLYFTCPEPYCEYAELPEGPGSLLAGLRPAVQRPPLVEGS